MGNSTFSLLIKQILEEEDINLSAMYRQLYDLGMNITYSSLYSYFSGKTVPPFPVAKEILEKQKVQLDDSELIDILEYSKRIHSGEREDSKVLNLNLKIKPSDISKEYRNNPGELKSLIEMRANEKMGNDNQISQFSSYSKRKTSAYVASLIKKDLIDNGYIEEKAKER